LVMLLANGGRGDGGGDVRPEIWGSGEGEGID
jgi:hypothetical protein